MHRSSVEENLQGFQSVKTNMHCLLLNNGLELTMKGLDHKLKFSVRQKFSNQERFILEILLIL